MSAIDRIVTDLRKYRTEPAEPEYRCRACQDTGWIEVDDGLEDGRRVRAPREARCTSIAHEKLQRPSVTAPERFS